MGRGRSKRRNQPAAAAVPQQPAAQKKKPMSNTVKVALITAIIGMIGGILNTLISTTGNVWIANTTAVKAENSGQGFQISEDNTDWESGHPFGFHARLDNITDTDSALKWLDNRMFLFSNHEDQQNDVTLLCVKFLDDASAYAAGKAVPERDIEIGENEVSDIMRYADRGGKRTRPANVETSGQKEPPSLTVISRMDGEISLTLSEDVLNTELGRVEVRKSYLTETLDLSDAQFQEDLAASGKLRFTYDTSIVNEKPVVSLGVPDVVGQNDAGYVTLRLPNISETPDREVMLLNQEPVESRYNAETQGIVTTVKSSGLYAVQENFTDIANLSKEMQNAIRSLSVAGVIISYSDNSYYPNILVTRAQFISILMRFLRQTNITYGPHITYGTHFTDVSSGTYFYHAVTGAERNGYISGFNDGTFRPYDQADRLFVYTTIAKVMRRNARMKNLSSPEVVLRAAFPKDTELSSLTGEDRMYLALCVRLGILTPSDDGVFHASDGVSRGEMALALYRMTK